MSLGRRDPDDGLAYREVAFATGPVESAWTLEIGQDADPALPYLVLPDGSLDVLHRLAFDRHGHVAASDLLVAGPDDRASRVPIRPGERFAGLRFRPGEGGGAIGITAIEVARRVVPAADVAPRLGGLADVLAERSRPDIPDLLRRVIAPRQHNAPREARALAGIALLRGSGGRLPVSAAARRLGISPRTFRREVANASGLGPKALSRVFRFRRALSLLAASRPSLAELADRTGYADQAHMTRDFQELGGFTPREMPTRLTT